MAYFEHLHTMSLLILEIDKEDTTPILQKTLKLREIKGLAQGHMKFQAPSKLQFWLSTYLVSPLGLIVGTSNPA